MKLLFKTYTLALVGATALAGVCAFAGRPAENSAAVTPPQAAFFESKIRPLLADRCYSCHSGDSPKAGLHLDSREGILKGAASGPAVLPGDPEHSPLINVIHYDGKIKMPPTGKLNASEIADLTQWVKMGAPWPDNRPNTGTTNSAPYIIPPSARSFWSFQPLHKPAVPTVINKAWVKNPIDAFVLAKLEAKGLTPAAPADKRTLIRRATYDLIGLPPTPAEINAFLADKSPNAFAKVVDRLLASPHYGERWGRHWLDTVRYADSNGLDENTAFAYAYRYRDYVVNAFNKDKPYDQFVCEQLAGDLLPAANDDERAEHLTATGFLVMGAKVLAEPDKAKLEMDIVDEQIEVTSKAFLGLTVACARCHNHKFDPIPTTDYYALAGIFKSTKTMATLNTVAQVFERPVATQAEKAAAEGFSRKVQEAQTAAQQVRAQANEEILAKIRPQSAKYLMASAELAKQPGTVSYAEKPTEPGETRIALEAETFVRGTAIRDTDTFGVGIGVVRTGSAPTSAEWDIEIAQAGTYQLEFRYAAQESRPVHLSLNDKLVRPDAAGSVTGGWGPDKQKWEPQGHLLLSPGKNTLKIESENAFPHFDKLLLVKVNPLQAGMPQTAEQIAQKYGGLHVSVLQQWTHTLSGAKSDAVLGAWAAFAALPATDFASSADHLAAQIAQGKGLPTTPAPAVVRQFTGLHPRRLQDVADAYGTLFASVEAAWQEAKKTGVTTLPNADLETVRVVLNHPKGLGAIPDNAEMLYSSAQRTEIAKAEANVKTAQEEAKKHPMPMAMAVTEDRPEDVRVHIRGNTLTLGEVAPRRFLTVLAGEHQMPIDKTHSGRLELARWITSANNPLPARVEVNRIWQEHFGAGLSRTPENFGLLGERPSHPQLLDWLAVTFREGGWSLKKMHRLILLSSTWQMSDAPNAKAQIADPDNRLLWHTNRRRLEAEPFRDAILSVAGTIDLTMGGSLMSTPDGAYVTNDQSNSGVNYTAPRRSIYLPIIRNDLYDMFLAFDMGDPSAVNAKRATTTVAPQALWAMNSPFVLEQAKKWAVGLLADTKTTDAGRIKTMYLKAYGRTPTLPETNRALGFVSKMEARLAAGEPDAARKHLRAWQSLCQVLFASNEFLYID